MISIKSDIWINNSDLTFQAVRSSGAGGQHVNKVSTKVILICPVSRINGLSDQQTELLYIKLKSNIFNGEIRISSQKHRSQYSNKLDAIEKLKFMLQKALKERKPRYKMRIPKSVNEKRLKEKRIRSQLKNSRHINPLSDMD